MKYFRTLAAFAGLAPLAFAALDSADYRAAVEFYTQHKPLEAQQAFEMLATAHPADGDVQFYLGRLALQRDDAEKAVAYLEKSVQLTPNDSRYHHRLGDAYGRTAQKASLFSQMGLAKKCRTEYEKAVELDGKNLDARQSLMSFYLQAPGFAGGSNEKALEQALAVKQINLLRGRQLCAQVYAADKKYDQAFAEFDAALKSSPDDYTSLYQVGRLAANTGQSLDRGLASLRRCVELTPPEGEPGHAAAHWRIGNLLEKKGDKPGARAAYEAALKVDPKFAQASEALKKL
ncbi:MAG: tetratricopeptide repeat protein [bacterium]|nr:tetratricopeptide repeat protein [bacterium]MDI1335671.1 tetratricopeptide repeat protein [Lacunisphaera sp.]